MQASQTLETGVDSLVGNKAFGLYCQACTSMTASDFPEALELLVAAITEYKSTCHGDWYRNLAWCYLNAGEFQQALEVYRLALDQFEREISHEFFGCHAKQRMGDCIRHISALTHLFEGLSSL